MDAELSRFLLAQTDSYESALRELQTGRKHGHWMWFIFPQLRGLGRSETSRHYGITDITEARAYLAHPVLGSRLLRCTRAVLELKHNDLQAVFGQPDDLKFISSMTLFSAVPGAPDLFRRALAQYNEGKEDLATHELLTRQTREGN